MLCHHIDHVVIRDGQLFAYGWGFMPGSKVLGLQLKIELHDGSATIVEVEYGQPRQDVNDAFSHLPESENCGFVLVAGFKEQDFSRAVLLWDFDHHAPLELALSVQPEQDTATKQPTSNKHRLKKAVVFDHYKALLIKSLTLLRSAGVRALIRKVRFYLDGKPKTLDDTMWQEIKTSLQDKPLVIVVDHDMGGGANIYRNKDIRERIATGQVILLLGFHVASLQYFLEIHDGADRKRYSIPSIAFMLSLIAHTDVQQIIYNCAVSFRQPFAVAELLIGLKKTTKAHLLVLIHDYFLICPSHFLIDKNHEFCGVPDLSRCHDCLPNHKDGFVSMSGVRDIVIWRKEWANLLIVANEVRMFSEASKALLQKAYPTLDTQTWRVQPHVLHTESPVIQLAAGDHLHIGVVGTVGKHKGSQIVAALATEIQHSHSTARITVIGTLEAKAPSDIVTITGAYQPEQLAETIKNSGVNVLLFPSIWAETFSYVSHELVAMEVPFACFDFGAPADLARKYQRGKVLDSMHATEILKSLEEFRSEIYQLSPEVV